MGPAPSTRAVWPFWKPLRRTACAATASGSLMAATRSETSSGTRCRYAAGERKYSLRPPPRPEMPTNPSFEQALLHPLLQA